MKFPTPPTWLPLLIRVSVTVLIVCWVWSGIQPGDSWEAMRDAPSWVWFVPAMMLLTVSMIHAWRIRILLRGLAVECRFGVIWSAILRGQFVGLALPRGGGDVARLAWLSRHTGRSDAVVAVGLGARLLELAPWMLLLFYGLAWGLMDWNPVLGPLHCWWGLDLPHFEHGCIGVSLACLELAESIAHWSRLASASRGRGVPCLRRVVSWCGRCSDVSCGIDQHRCGDLGDAGFGVDVPSLTSWRWHLRRTL